MQNWHAAENLQTTIAGLQLDVISNFGELERLSGEWSELIERCPKATPFQSPAWMLPWWRHLGGGELLVVTWRSDERLVGIAPLFIHEWQGRRQVSPLGVSISDHFDVLFEPEFAHVGAGMLLAFLAESRGRWEICILPELDQTSPLIAAPISAGMQAEVEPLDVCPILELPSSVEEFEAKISAHHRRNLRRAARLLEKAGGGEIERATEASAAEFMDALFRLHAARWKEQAQPGVLVDERVQEFHREAAARFQACGMLRLYGLVRNGEIAAVLYALALGGRTYAYLGGFDPSLDFASPGTLLTYRAIQDAILEGCREYDLLRGKENHKYVWGAQDRQNYRLVLTHTKQGGKYAKRQ